MTERQPLVCPPLSTLRYIALGHVPEHVRGKVVELHLAALGVYLRAADLLSRARRKLCSASLHDPARSSLAREIAQFLDAALGGKVPGPEGSVTDGRQSGNPGSAMEPDQAPGGGSSPSEDGGRVRPDHDGAPAAAAADKPARERPAPVGGRKRRRRTPKVSALGTDAGVT
jgi:hypothetical protein